MDRSPFRRSAPCNEHCRSSSSCSTLILPEQSLARVPLRLFRGPDTRVYLLSRQHRSLPEAQQRAAARPHRHARRRGGIVYIPRPTPGAASFLCSDRREERCASLVPRHVGVVGWGRGLSQALPRPCRDTPMPPHRARFAHGPLAARWDARASDAACLSC